LLFEIKLPFTFFIDGSHHDRYFQVFSTCFSFLSTSLNGLHILSMGRLMNVMCVSMASFARHSEVNGLSAI
jgi:hypothetical protein